VKNCCWLENLSRDSLLYSSLEVDDLQSLGVIGTPQLEDVKGNILGIFFSEIVHVTLFETIAKNRRILLTLIYFVGRASVPCWKKEELNSNHWSLTYVFIPQTDDFFSQLNILCVSCNT